MERVEGYIVDIEQREIYHGVVEIESGRISKLIRLDVEATECGASLGYIMPGFIDSHLHIESSMLTPKNFGQMVIARGTVGVVTDPHEIANVMGVEGVEFMVESAKRSPIRMHFTIPSSVPATPFDRAGATLTAEDVEALASSGRFVGLSEMMNVPGVLFRDEEVMAKLAVAHRYKMRVDGHAPLLAGADLERYVSEGISSDHECSNIDEAREKISRGMVIQIREGSAARDYEALKSLIAEAPESLLFCTDDAHPGETLTEGHIDKIVRRGVADGFDLFDLLRIASLNPIRHYGLAQGGLSIGSEADFIVVDNLSDFTTQRVYIGGELRYDSSTYMAASESERGGEPIINNFNHDMISLSDLKKSVAEGESISVIGVIPDQIITKHEHYTPKSTTANLESDIESDIAKIVYINRYYNTPPVVAYCKGFGLKRGAVASCIAHDSHNITAIGVSDRDIMEAVNALIANRGGLAVSHAGRLLSLPLPIAGIISDQPAEIVAASYEALQHELREMGSPHSSPFMTLSFLSIVVIPQIKIGEKGLFSYDMFNWI